MLTDMYIHRNITYSCKQTHADIVVGIKSTDTCMQDWTYMSRFDLLKKSFILLLKNLPAKQEKTI